MHEPVLRLDHRHGDKTMSERTRTAVAVAVLVCACSGWLPGQEPAAGGRELVINGRFEEGQGGWTFGHGWYESPKGSGVSAGEFVSGAGRNGGTCVKLTGANNRGLIMQQMQIWPDTFRVSGWVKCEDLGDAEAGILIEWMEGGQARKYVGNQSTPRVRGTTEWTRVEATFKTPVNARLLHVDLLTTAPNNGTAWFDDISMVDLTEDHEPPPPVTFSALAPDGDTQCVKLAWTSPADDAMLYYVFAEARPFTDTAGLVPRLQIRDKTEAVVRGLPNGETVHVGVVAVDADGNCGETTRSVAGTPADREPPRPVAASVQPLHTGSAESRAAMVWWQPYLLDEDVVAVTITAPGVAPVTDAPTRQVLVRGIPSQVTALRITATDAAGNVGQAAEVAFPSFPGRVPATRAALSGTVRARPGESPLPGATVRLLHQGREIKRTSSRADGTFAFSELPAEPLQVVAERDGFLCSAGDWVLPGVAPIGLALTLAPLEGRPYSAWIASPVAQIFQDDEAPVDRGTRVQLTSARNEVESFQVVVRPSADMTDVSLNPSALVSADGLHVIPAESVSWHPVRYCHIDKNSKATPQEELVRRAPAEYPDELGETGPVALEAGRTQPLYVLLRTPADAAPGSYTGRVYLRTAHGDDPFDIMLRVLPFSLPETPRLHVVVWNNCGQVRDALGVDAGSADAERVLRMLMRTTGAHQQTAWLMSWHGVPLYQWADGSLKADWRGFDRELETAIELGVGQRICFGHIGGRGPGGWTAPTFVLRDKAAVDRRTGRSRLVRLEQWLPLLQRHLEEKGWLDRSLQHVADEPIDSNVGSWREQSRRVHAAAPKLRRIDAIHVVDLRGDLEVFVPQLNYFNQARDTFLEYQRNGEAEVWFYTAWVPQGRYPNRMIDSAAIKPRVLHWLNYLYDTKGYLHWALNAWQCKLGTFSPGDEWITWKSATRGLNSSIRYEAMRDGLEDVQYLCLLEEAQRRVAKALGVSPFDAGRRGKEIAHTAVRGCTDYVRSHDEVDAVRVRVAEEITSTEQAPLLLTRAEPPTTGAIEPGEVQVSGWVEDGARIRVNGRAIRVGGGRFETTASVTEAARTVVVQAEKGGREKRVSYTYRVTDPLLREGEAAIAVAREAGADVASAQHALDAYRGAAPGESKRLRKALEAALAAVLRDEMRARCAPLRARPASASRDAVLRDMDELLMTGRTPLARQLSQAAAGCRLEQRSEDACRLEPVVRFGRVGYRLANGRLNATLWIEGARIIDLEIDGVPLLYHKDTETPATGAEWFDVGGYEDAGESLHLSALQPWQLTVVEDTADRVAVRCAHTRFVGWGNVTLSRVVELKRGQARLALHYAIANDGDREVEYTWRGHTEFAVHGDPAGDELVVPAGSVRAWERFVTGGVAGDWTLPLAQPFVGVRERGAAVFHTLDKQVREAYIWAGGSFYTIEPRATFHIPAHGTVTFSNGLGER